MKHMGWILVKNEHYVLFLEDYCVDGVIVSNFEPPVDPYLENKSTTPIFKDH